MRQRQFQYKLQDKAENSVSSYLDYQSLLAIAQAEQNQIPLYSDPRASFVRFLFGVFWVFFGSGSLEHIFLCENCKYLTCFYTLMLQKALRTTRVQSCYSKAGTSSWHETEKLKEKGIFKHGIKLQIILFSN